MRKEERGEERDTTTHLIKFQVFTHASRVTNFSTHNTVHVQLVAFALLKIKQKISWHLARPPAAPRPHPRAVHARETAHAYVNSRDIDTQSKVKVSKHGK